MNSARYKFRVFIIHKKLTPDQIAKALKHFHGKDLGESLHGVAGVHDLLHFRLTEVGAGYLTLSAFAR